MTTQKSLVISRPDGKVEVIALTAGMKFKAIPGATYSVVADGVLQPVQILNDGHGNAVLTLPGGALSGIEITDYYTAAVAAKGSLIFARAEGSGQIVAIPSSASSVTGSETVPTPLSTSQATPPTMINSIVVVSESPAVVGSILQGNDDPLTSSGIAQSVASLANEGLYQAVQETALTRQAGADPTTNLLQESGAFALPSYNVAPPQQAVVLNNTIGQRILRGDAEPGMTVLILDGAGAVIARVAVDSSGHWSLDYKTTVPPLPEGVSAVQILVRDQYGNTSEPLNTTVVVDTVAPLAPMIDATIATPGGHFATVTTDGNGATASTRPVFTGNAGVGSNGQPEAGIQINLYDNGQLIGSGVSNAAGQWSITPTSPLKNGLHKFTVRGMDSSGNESGDSPVYSFVVDTIAPKGLTFIEQGSDDVGPVTGSFVSGASINDARPALSGRSGGGVGEQVAIYRDGVQIGVVTPAGGTWRYQEPNALAEGSYSYTSRVIDKAGNVGALSAPFTLTVDTVAPPKAHDISLYAQDGAAIGLDTVTGSRVITVRLKAEAGATVSVYDQTTGSVIGSMTEVAGSPGNYTFTSPRLNSGNYQYVFLVTDKAGNVASQETSASAAFSVETVGPAQTIYIDSMGLDTGLSQTDFITDSGAPTKGNQSRVLTGHLSSALAADSGVNVQISINGGAWENATVSGQQWFYNDTQSHTGDWTYTARLVDSLGNTSDSQPTQQVVLDTTPPPGGGTLSVSEYVAAGTEARPVNYQTVQANDGATVTYSLAGTGARVGDMVQISWGDQIQSVIVPALDAQHSDTPAATVTATFTAGQIQAAGSSTHLTISAKLTDIAGNVALLGATTQVSVDVVAPAVPTLTVDSGSLLADQYLNSAERTQALHFVLTGEGDAAAVAGDTVTLLFIDKASAATITKTLQLQAADISAKGFTVGLSDLASQMVNGDSYDLRVQITDRVGNSSQQILQTSFTYDVTPPDAPVITTISTPRGSTLTITSGGRTGDPYPMISGTAEANATVTLYQSSNNSVVGKAIADKNGNWSYSVPAEPPLADATYSWYAVATDQAGNVGPTPSSSISFTVDAVGPTQLVTITGMSKDTGSSDGDFITADGTSGRQVSGTISAPLASGEVLQVSSDGGATWHAIAVNADDKWTYTDNTAHVGHWSIVARITDSTGQVGPGAATQAVTLDTTAPVAPQASFEGTVVNDGVVNIQDLKTPLSITTNVAGAQAGDTLKLTWGSLVKQITLTQADITKGTVSTLFSLQNLNTVVDGVYTVSAQIVDIAGNASTPTSVTYGSDGQSQLVLGTHAPTPPQVTLSSNLSDQVINRYDYDNRIATPYTITAELKNTGIQVGGQAVLNWGGQSYAVTLSQSDINNGKVTWFLDTLIQASPGGYDGTAWAGSHKVSVILIDRAGNASTARVLGNFIEDITPPAAPVVLQIDTTNGTNTSVFPVDGATIPDSRPVIVGTSEPGNLIAVFNGAGQRVDVNGDGVVLSYNSQGQLVNSAGAIYDSNKFSADYVTADNSGTWSYQPFSPLAKDSYSFTFKALDSAFNVSAESSSAVSFTVDSNAPTQTVTIDKIARDTGISDSDFITNTGLGQTVTGSISGALGPGVKLTVVIDGVTYANPSITTDATGRITWTVADSRAHTGDWKITAYLSDTSAHQQGTLFIQSVVLDTTSPAPATSVTVLDSAGNNLATSAEGINIQDKGGVYLHIQFEPSSVSPNTPINIVLTSTNGVGIPIPLPVYTLTSADVSNGFVNVAIPADKFTNVTSRDIQFYVTMNDVAGNSSSSALTAPVHVDTVAPTSAGLMVPVNGNDIVTVENRKAGVVLTGQAEPGGKVSVVWNVNPGSTGARDVIELSSASGGGIRVDSDGRWTATVAASDIPDNVYRPTSLTVVQTDSAGNVSDPAIRAPLLATHPPEQPTFTLTNSKLFGDDILNLQEGSAGVVISGAQGEVGSTLTMIWGAVTKKVAIANDGSWAVSVAKSDIPSDGQTTITISQTDAVGNVSTKATHEVTIDTVLPRGVTVESIAGTEVQGAGQVIYINASEEQNGFTLSGTGAERGGTVYVSWQDNAGQAITQSATSNNGQWAVTFRDGASSLIKGTGLVRPFSVWQVDSAGNASNVNLSPVTIDTEIPVAPLVSTALQINRQAVADMASSITYSGKAEPGSQVSFILNAGQVSKNAIVDPVTGNWSVTLSVRDDVKPPFIHEGLNSVTVYQTDSAGNVSSPFLGNLNLDLTSPDAPTPDVPTGILPGTSQAVDQLVSGSNYLNSKNRADGVTVQLNGVETNALGAQWVWRSSGQTIAATKVDGRWQVVLNQSDIPSGTAPTSYYLQQTDLVGNVTEIPTSFRHVAIDTVAPPSVNVSNYDSFYTKDGAEFFNYSKQRLGQVSISLSGVEAGATGSVVWHQVGGSAWAGSSAAIQFDATGRAYAIFYQADLPSNGINTALTMVQTDTAGNVSAPIVSATIHTDYTLPTGLGITGLRSPVAGESVAEQTDLFINQAEKAAGLSVNGTAMASEVGSTVNVSWGTGSATKTATVASDGTWSVSFAPADIPPDTDAVRLSASMTDTAGNVAAVGESGIQFLGPIRIDANPPSLTPYQLTELSADTSTHRDGIINFAEKNSGIVLSNLPANVPGNVNSDIAAVEVIWGRYTSKTTTHDSGRWELTLAASDLPSTDSPSASPITVNYFDLSGNKTTESAKLQLSNGTMTTGVNLDYSLPSILTINDIDASDGVSGDTLNQSDRSRNITVSGTGEVGAQVNVVWGNASRGATVASGGTWKVTFAQSDNVGVDSPTSVIVATETDTAGNVKLTPVTHVVNLDTTAPTAAPVVNPVGVGSTHILNQASEAAGVTISGTAEAGATVNLIWTGANGGVVTKQVSAGGAGGAWSTSIAGSDFPNDGASSIVVSQTDSAGNVSTSKATQAVQIDTISPGVPTISVVGVGDVINATQKAAGVTVSGSAEAGATGTVAWGSTTKNFTANNGSWSVVFSNSEIPSDSAASPIVATQTDSAGNASTIANWATRTVNIDTVAPSSTAPTIELVGVNNDLINRVKKDAGIVLTGTLPEGGERVNVIWNGQTKAASVRSFSDTNTNKWNVSFAASDLTGFSDGAYLITLIQTDSVGNVSAQTVKNVVIDTTIAAATVNSIVSGTNVINASQKAAGVSFTGAGEAGDSLTAYWGANSATTTVASNGSWSVSFGPSAIPADGDVTLSVLQTDSAGNVSTVGSSSTQTIHIDTNVGLPSITAATGGSTAHAADPVAGTLASVASSANSPYINSYENAHGFTMSGQAEAGSGSAHSTVNVVWNGRSTSVAANAEGRWDYVFRKTDLPSTDGSFEVSVNQTDAAGNVSGFVKQTLIIDTALNAPVPGSSLGSYINAQQKASGVTFSALAQADAMDVVFQWNGQTYHGNKAFGTTSWSVSIPTSDIPSPTQINGQSYVLSMYAIDSAGNQSAPTTQNVTVDLVAPSSDPGANFTIAEDGTVGSAERAGGFTLSGVVDPNSQVQVVLNDGAGHTVSVEAQANNLGVWSARVSSLPLGTFRDTTSAYASVVQLDQAGNSVISVRTFATQSAFTSLLNTDLALDLPNAAGVYGSYSAGDKISFTFNESVNLLNLNQAGAVSTASGVNLGSGYTFSGVGNPNDIFMKGLGTSFSGLYELVSTAPGSAALANFNSLLPGGVLPAQFALDGTSNAVDFSKPIYHRGGSQYMFALQGGGYVISDLSTSSSATSEWYYSSNASGLFAAGTNPAESSVIAGWFRATKPSGGQMGGSSSTVAAGASSTAFYSTVELTLGDATTLQAGSQITFNPSLGGSTPGVLSSGGNTVQASTPANAPLIRFAAPLPGNSIEGEDAGTLVSSPGSSVGQVTVSGTADGVKNNALLLNFTLPVSGLTLGDLVLNNEHSFGSTATLTPVGPASGGAYTSWLVTFGGTGVTVASGDTITISSNRLVSGGVTNPSGKDATFTIPDIVAPTAAPLLAGQLTTRDNAAVSALDLDNDGIKNNAVIINFSEKVRLSNLLAYNASLGVYQFSAAAAVAVSNGHTLGTGYSVIALDASGKPLPVNASLSASSTDMASSFEIIFGSDSTITGSNAGTAATNDTITLAKAGVVDNNGNTSATPVVFTMPDLVPPPTPSVPSTISGNNYVNAMEEAGTTPVQFGLSGIVAGDVIHTYINGIEVGSGTALSAGQTSYTWNITGASTWGSDGVKTLTTRVSDAEGNYSPHSANKLVTVDSSIGSIKSVSIVSDTVPTSSLNAGDQLQVVFSEPVSFTSAALNPSVFGTGASVSAVDSGLGGNATTWKITLGSGTTLGTSASNSNFTIGTALGKVSDFAGNTDTVSSTVPTGLFTNPSITSIGNIGTNNIITTKTGNQSVTINLQKAQAGDVIQLNIDGQAEPSLYTVTAADVSANAATLSVAGSHFGADGAHQLTATIHRPSTSFTSALSAGRSVYMSAESTYWALQTNANGTGAVLWFDPDTLTLPAGSKVSSWAAATGNSTATQATAANQPTLLSLNGHNVLYLNNTAWMTYSDPGRNVIPTAATGGISMTGFAAVVPFNITQQYQAAFAFYNGSRGLKLGASGSKLNYTTYGLTDNTGPVNSLNQNVGTALSMRLSYSAATGVANLQGYNQWSQDINVTGRSALVNMATAPTGFAIGTDANIGAIDTATNWPGMVGDMIWVNGAMTNAQMQEIITYIDAKYALQGIQTAVTLSSQSYDLTASKNAQSTTVIDNILELQNTALGVGNDTVRTAGADYVNAGAGNDVIRIGDLQFRQIDGGNGTDTLTVDTSYTGAATIELSDFVSNARGMASTGGNDNFTIADNTRVNANGFHKLYGIEALDLSLNSSAQTLRLRKGDVNQLSEDKTLRVVLGDGDRVELMDETATSGAAQWNQWEGSFVNNGRTYNQKFLALDGTGATIYTSGGVAAPHVVGATVAGSTLSVAFDASMGTPPTTAGFSVTTLSGSAFATPVTVTGSSVTAGSLGRSLDFTLSSVPASSFIVSYSGNQITEAGTTRDTLVKKWYVGLTGGANVLDASAETQSVALIATNGSQTLKGGSGSDVLVAEGVGNNTMTGGGVASSGFGSSDMVSDTFVIRKGHTQVGGGSDVIKDFDRSDKLDLRDLLSGYTNDTTQASKYLKLVGDGSGNLRLSIDSDGVPFGQSFTETNSVLLQGLQGITYNGHVLDADYINNTLALKPDDLQALLNQLIANQNIITH